MDERRIFLGGFVSRHVYPVYQPLCNGHLKLTIVARNLTTLEHGQRLYLDLTIRCDEGKLPVGNCSATQVLLQLADSESIFDGISL